MFQFNTLNASKKPGLIPCNESRRGSFGKENMNKEFRRGSAALIDVKPGVYFSLHFYYCHLQAQRVDYDIRYIMQDIRYEILPAMMWICLAVLLFNLIIVCISVILLWVSKHECLFYCICTYFYSPVFVMLWIWKLDLLLTLVSIQNSIFLVLWGCWFGCQYCCWPLYASYF